MPIYTGNSNVSKKVGSKFAYVNGATRKISQQFVGANGLTKKVFGGANVTVPSPNSFKWEIYCGKSLVDSLAGGKWSSVYHDPGNIEIYLTYPASFTTFIKDSNCTMGSELDMNGIYIMNPIMINKQTQSFTPDGWDVVATFTNQELLKSFDGSNNCRLLFFSCGCGGSQWDELEINHNYVTFEWEGKTFDI